MQYSRTAVLNTDVTIVTIREGYMNTTAVASKSCPYYFSEDCHERLDADCYVGCEGFKHCARARIGVRNELERRLSDFAKAFSAAEKAQRVADASSDSPHLDSQAWDAAQSSNLLNCELFKFLEETLDLPREFDGAEELEARAAAVDAVVEF